MIRKLVTIGALGLVIAVSGCRNPDDRATQAGGTEQVILP
jgi:hypothetical protein